MALYGVVICFVSDIVFTGYPGRDIPCSGILFYKTRLRNSAVRLTRIVMSLSTPTFYPSSVSCNIVCVHQVAELLYVNVPFACVSLRDNFFK